MQEDDHQKEIKLLETQSLQERLTELENENNQLKKRNKKWVDAIEQQANTYQEAINKLQKELEEYKTKKQNSQEKAKNLEQETDGSELNEQIDKKTNQQLLEKLQQKVKHIKELQDQNFLLKQTVQRENQELNYKLEQSLKIINKLQIEQSFQSGSDNESWAGNVDLQPKNQQITLKRENEKLRAKCMLLSSDLNTQKSILQSLSKDNDIKKIWEDYFILKKKYEKMKDAYISLKGENKFYQESVNILIEIKRLHENQIRPSHQSYKDQADYLVNESKLNELKKYLQELMKNKKEQESPSLRTTDITNKSKVNIFKNKKGKEPEKKEEQQPLVSQSQFANLVRSTNSPQVYHYDSNNSDELNFYQENDDQFSQQTEIQNGQENRAKSQHSHNNTHSEYTTLNAVSSVHSEIKMISNHSTYMNKNTKKL